MKYLTGLQCLTGIAIAVLLFMAGISGAILAFYYEVDEALNPRSYRVEPVGSMLPPPVLIERLEMARPEIQVWYLQYPNRGNETAMLTAQPKPGENGQYPEIQSDVFYLNPATAEIVDERYWGRCCFERSNFLNFIYELHHSLKNGAWGGYVMGLVALALMLNCLLVIWRCCFGTHAGFGTGMSLFLIPTKNKLLAFVLALLLLPVAISSIALNLSQEVFKPLVSVFSPVSLSIYEEYSKRTTTDFGTRVLSYNDAWRLAQQKGRENNWPGPVAELFYSSSYNFYGMAFGHRDPDGLGNNWIYLDGDDGQVVGTKTPRSGTLGDRLYFIQLPLHSGRLAGLPSKIAISFLGLLIAALSCRYLYQETLRLFRSSRAESPRKKGFPV